MRANEVAEGATDPIVWLADNVHRTQYEALSSQTVDMTKRFILDVIATTIAGSQAPMVREVLQLFKMWGGSPEATIAVDGGRLPAHHAAAANVMMCHALELDEFHDAACTHALTPAFWSALAAAELIGGCNGRTFLTSVVVAADLKHRLGLATGRMYYLGYHKARLATLAAAAAACKIAATPADVLMNALGIAYCQSAGTTQTLPDGALMKRLQPALNTSDGLRAVSLARNGVKGAMNLVAGSSGLLAVYNDGEDRRALIKEGLGIEFLGASASVKRYPSCRCANGPIEAIVRLKTDYHFQSHEVRRIVVRVSEGCVAISGQAFAGKTGSPQVDAQFSIDYNIAIAIMYGDVFAQHFEEPYLSDPAVRDLAAKVAVEVMPGLEGQLSFEPVVVTVHLSSGCSHTFELAHMRGTPHNPMSWDDFVEERLQRCVEFSGLDFSEKQVRLLTECVREIEEVQDVRKLLNLMAPGK